MSPYEKEAFKENQRWQKKMLRRPGIMSRASKRLQNKVNSYIPEKIHQAITVAVKQMIQAVIFGSKYTTPKPLNEATLEARERLVQNRIKNYRTTAAVEGGITGAGGILLGLADFPLLLGIKMKLLFDIAALYGYDVKDAAERLYILRVFELTFSSDAHRKDVFLKMKHWDEKAGNVPQDEQEIEWRRFQQEYRDYLDIAKLAQLIPVVGAPIGFVVNYRLIKRLGRYAMNAYRMRSFEFEHP